MMWWAFITRLGGIYVMMPAAIAIAAWLWGARAWRMALWWCAVFSGSLLLIIATKIFFIGWGYGIRSLDFTGISGHSARAMAIFPVLFFLVLQKTPPVIRISGMLFGFLLGAIIGVSRLKLHAHSISEVVAGWVLGGIVSVAFICIFEQPRIFVLDRWMVALGFVALFAATFVKPAPTQRWMISYALFLSGHDRPYVRQGWKLAPANWNHQKSIAGKVHQHPIVDQKKSRYRHAQPSELYA